jgi:membrane protein implicated in regulation of membrane protease activity
MDYIEQFGFHWFWFGLGTILLAIELVHGKFMFMAASLAAIVIGVLSHLYPYVAFPIQILFFGVAAAVFIWMSRALLRERAAKFQQQQELLTQRKYVGRELTLVSPIENNHATQDVDGMVWTLHGEDLPAGSRVKVVDMGEGWLKVERL